MKKTILLIGFLFMLAMACIKCNNATPGDEKDGVKKPDTVIVKPDSTRVMDTTIKTRKAGQ